MEIYLKLYFPHKIDFIDEECTKIVLDQVLFVQFFPCNSQISGPTFAKIQSVLHFVNTNKMLFESLESDAPKFKNCYAKRFSRSQNVKPLSFSIFCDYFPEVNNERIICSRLSFFFRYQSQYKFRIALNPFECKILKINSKLLT